MQTSSITSAMKKLQTELKNHQLKIKAQNSNEKQYPNPYIKMVPKDTPPITFNFEERNSSGNKSNNTEKSKRKLNVMALSDELHYKPNTPPVSPNTNDPLKIYRDRVAIAIQANRTFTVNGNCPAIREALVARGWIEKFHRKFREHLALKYRSLLDQSNLELVKMAHDAECRSLAKAIIMSNLLKDHQVDFYWNDNSLSMIPFDELPDLKKSTLVNKFKHKNDNCHCSKIGMCETARIAQTLHKSFDHPRTYNLSEGLDSFWDDFNTTSATCLLKHVVEMYKTKTTKIVSPTGTIPFQIFEFAIKECEHFIEKKKRSNSKNKNLNDNNDDNVRSSKTSIEWDQFAECFFKIVFYWSHFKQVHEDQTDEDVVAKATTMLKKIDPFYPYLNMDGTQNIWILKPFNGSDARGIYLCRTRRYILNILKNNQKLVAEKYIERPLLIYDTKFDIIQWFLISSAKPLTIWMWKNFYLRFSCQTYSLRKLHESIHLTNQCVQAKYTKHSIPEAALPFYHMWDGNQFQQYLSNIGYPEVFNQIIYPGIKKNIVTSTLINKKNYLERPNCFELFGAGFMLTNNFTPWLIEINCNPSMGYTNPIMNKLVPKCLEDVIRVMIDCKTNSKADTGSFELIFKEELGPRGLRKDKNADVLKKLCTEVHDIFRGTLRDNLKLTNKVSGV